VAGEEGAVICVERQKRNAEPGTQNEELRIGSSAGSFFIRRSAFCVLHFAFACLLLTSCSRTNPAPPPPPTTAPIVAEPPLPATIEEAQALKTADPAKYERALAAIGTPRAIAILGLYQLDGKRWDDAIASLTQAADAWPSVAPYLRLRIAQAEQQRGNLQHAIEVTQQIIATASGTSAAAIAQIRLPGLFALAGDTNAANAAYQTIASTPFDELSESEFADLVSTFEKANRIDLATAIRMRLITEYPQGRYTERAFARLLAMPDSPLLAMTLEETSALAARLAQFDHYDEALRLLERASSRFPEATKSAIYRNVRIRALFNSRHYAELLAETAKNHLEAPQSLLRARAAWRSGDAATFLATLSSIEDQFPQSKEALEAKLLRAKYFSTDEIKYDAAIENLNEAIQAGALGNDGENLWTLGWTYYIAGNFDEALRVFDRYLHDYPDGDYRTNSLFWSGRILASRGLMSERDTRFRELVAEYPYSYYAYRAKEIAGAGLAASPAVPHPFPDIEALIAQAGEPRVAIASDLASIDLMRDATREMKLASSAHPDNLGLSFLLADLYLRAGEPFKANGVLQRRFRDFVRHGGDNIPHRFWEILFPLHYWDTLQREAARQNVDPYTLASIIRQESGFEPATVSNAGAVGLMQIMPAEAQQIAQRAGIEGVTREALFDPEVNIAVGAAEYAQKLAAMQNRPVLAIAAYNAGETAVNNWLATTRADDIDYFVESIPYAETRLYVKTVTRNRNEYRRVYE